MKGWNIDQKIKKRSIYINIWFDIVRPSKDDPWVTNSKPAVLEDESGNIGGILPLISYVFEKHEMVLDALTLTYTTPWNPQFTLKPPNHLALAFMGHCDATLDSIRKRLCVRREPSPQRVMFRWTRLGCPWLPKATLRVQGLKFFNIIEIFNNIENFFTPDWKRFGIEKKSIPDWKNFFNLRSKIFQSGIENF